MTIEANGDVVVKWIVLELLRIDARGVLKCPRWWRPDGGRDLPRGCRRCRMGRAPADAAVEADYGDATARGRVGRLGALHAACC